MPDSVSGLTPTIALMSEIVMVPSSTRIPFGSVTVIEFASGASASKVTWPVIVTFVGETESVEPLIGFVLTTVFAEAFVAPRNKRSRIAVMRKRLTVSFHKGLGSSSIRAYRLTSLHLLPSLNLDWSL
jgi:hypothetical protein